MKIKLTTQLIEEHESIDEPICIIGCALAVRNDGGIIFILIFYYLSCRS